MSDGSKPGLRHLALVVLIPAMAAGCGARDPGTPYRARIVASAGNGAYELQTVTFKTLTSIDGVDGDLARIVGGAALDLNAEVDEIVTSQDPDRIYADRGEPADLDYIVKDDVVYPKNFDSMAMLAIYYNYENTVLFWESRLGLPRDRFGKLSLFYNPKIRASDKASTISGTLKINAAFVPGPRDFWFFKTSRLEKVPISMNQGVLAHEFGHGIFDFRFAGMDAAVYQGADAWAETQLSGINEGLADFFSFMVTGHVEDFGASLDALAEERRMPVPWRLSTLSDAPCADSFYCKGSILASALHQIATTEGQSAVGTGKVVYDALTEFRADWDAHKGETDFDYHLLIARIIAAATLADAAAKDLYCAVFKQWFDVASTYEQFGCD